MRWDKWGGKTSFYGVWRQQERLKPRSENLFVWLNVLLEIGFKDLAAFAQEICGKARLPPQVSIQKKKVEVSQRSLPLQNTSVSDILLPHLATASSHHLLETCETCSLSSNTHNRNFSQLGNCWGEWSQEGNSAPSCSHFLPPVIHSLVPAHVLSDHLKQH